MAILSLSDLGSHVDLFGERPHRGMFVMFARETGTLISHQRSGECNDRLSGYKLRFIMAEESGVTENVLKTKITQQLQATHVEIEDMSGILCPTMPLHCPRLDRNVY